MKKYFLIFSLIFCLTAGIAISEENSNEAIQPEPATEQTEKEKDCKKVCVQRDGYGKCTEFKERCEE